MLDGVIHEERRSKMKTTTLLLTLTLLLGACAPSPYEQQKAAMYRAGMQQPTAFLRPPEIDVGNVNSTIVGTINPANLGQGGIAGGHQ
jgi:PBP1b-binding outer membrane lipoprotein LpoB